MPIPNIKPARRVVTFRMLPELIAKIDRMVKQTGDEKRSRSELIERAVEELIARSESHKRRVRGMSALPRK